MTPAEMNEFCNPTAPKPEKYRAYLAAFLSRRGIAENFFRQIGPPDSNGCWPWLGYINADGYGQVSIRIDGVSRQFRAHRVAWMLCYGITALLMDHQCEYRACINPAHSKPATVKVNTLRGNGITANQARQTHCKREHPLSGDNLRIAPDGSRHCRKCKALSCAEYRKRIAR